MNRRVVLIAYGSGPGSRWPNKDIGVAEGQRPAAGTSAPTDDKERYRCTEGASYPSASSFGESTSGYSDESTAPMEDPGYWEESDRLQVAATELMRQADRAEASGDHEAAETLRIKADELQGESWAAVKGMKAGQKKRIPQGFKPMQRKTPMIKGQSQPATSEQPKIPQGFKPIR